MYSDDTTISHQSLLSNGLLPPALAESVVAEGRPISSDRRPERPRIVSVEDDEHATGRLSFTTPDIDNEQKISQELLAVEATDFIHENPFSAPPYEHVPAVPAWDGVSMSPAAMFLSAFSPGALTPQSDPDSEGEVVSGWTLGSVIGYGGFSTIRRAYSPSGGTVAVKIIRRTDISKQPNPSLVHKRLSHEAAVWASVSHEHILPLFSVSHTSYADFFFTLYCPAGSLFDILKRDGRPALPHDDAGMMFRQVVRGLRYLHEGAGLVHRDMKLENVLVDETGVCRIGDFGMTRKIGEIDEELDEVQIEDQPQQVDELSRAASMGSRRHTKAGLPSHLSVICHHSGHRGHRNSAPMPAAPGPASAHLVNVQPGSLPYAAPELLLPQISGPLRPHPAQDMWALGVMLYTMLTGNLPFRDSFEPRLQMKILHGVYDVPSDIGRGAERVLRGCLERSVSSRWTIAMVDEIAWGVGWGTDSDDSAAASPEDEEDFELIEHPNVQTGTESTPATHTDEKNIEEWKNDEESKHDLTRPSLEASQRRSSSRTNRFVSRAPALTTRSSTARSTSRASNPTSPSFSALTNSILSTTSSMSSSSSSAPDDSALLVSPAHSYERGRRPTKARVLSTSRSPSPSVVPATPIDFCDGPSRFPGSVEADREVSRGRKAFNHGVRTPRAEHFGAGETDLDVLDETQRWRCNTRKGGSSVGERALDSSRTRDESPLERVNERWVNVDRGVWKNSKGRRAGSTPPAPTSSWFIATPVGHEEDGTSSLRFSDSRGGAMPMSIPTNSARSRSVGWGASHVGGRMV